MAIVLDPLRDDDREPLFQWIQDRELVELSATFRPVGREEHDAWFDDIRARDDVAIFAIREDGRLVGTCQLLCSGTEAELRIRIGVAEARDRGLGTAAVRLLVAHGFQRLGLERIWLQVFAHNARAIRAYEKVGFARCGAPGATLRMQLRR